MEAGFAPLDEGLPACYGVADVGGGANSPWRTGGSFPHALVALSAVTLVSRSASLARGQTGTGTALVSELTVTVAVGGSCATGTATLRRPRSRAATRP